jgi:hypothetical protein
MRKWEYATPTDVTTAQTKARGTSSSVNPSAVHLFPSPPHVHRTHTLSLIPSSKAGDDTVGSWPSGVPFRWGSQRKRLHDSGGMRLQLALLAVETSL